MAKKFFTNFKAAVDSFPLGEQKTGFMKPGRYNGYDTMSTNGALNIIITHSGLLKKTGKDNNFLPNFGALMFPTGQILHDEDQIPLVIDGNSGNNNVRTDLIIVEHTYQEVSGGTPVSYSVIKGPNNGTVPTLTNPQKQVLIGKVTITPNGYLFTDITYIPELSPLPGDITYNVLTQYINQVVNIPIADESTLGISRRAGLSEVIVGLNDTAHVTPLKLHNKIASTTERGLVQRATDTEVLNGDEDTKYVTSKQLRGKGLKVALTGNYTLNANDHGKIFINNSGNLISITVPTGLGTNVHFGFIAGLNNISIVGNSGVVIRLPSNKLAETKGLNTAILLESNSVANEYFLLGSLKTQ